MYEKISISTSLTKVGGTLYMRIPAAVMKMTGINRMSDLSLVFQNGQLVIVPGGTNDQ